MLNLLKRSLVPKSIPAALKRCYADVCGEGTAKKGLILGAYDGCNPGEYKLSATAKKFDEGMEGKLTNLLKGAQLGRGQAEVYTNVHIDYAAIAVAGLGPEGEGMDTLEGLDVCKENIRVASAVAASKLQNSGVNTILVEGFTNSEAAAEGAALAVWQYQEFKNKEEQQANTKLELFESPEGDGFKRGLIKAECQNLARTLEEAPANRLTPYMFAERAVAALCSCGVQVNVRDKHWLEEKKMNAFLTMAKGSCQPPLLLELGYCAAAPEEKPVLIIGKGLTFDSGGLFTKKCEGMMKHRADMAAAAVAVGVFKCAAMLNLPVNIKALLPLAENLPGGLAVKPGDVVMGLNGKSIRIDHTDAEGRVIMADPLVFAASYKPCLIITLGTMTDVDKALGSGGAALFTDSEVVWREMHRAGAETGDRVWRFPLWKNYRKKVTDHISVDVTNKVTTGGGEACICAAFLKEFAPPDVDFCHMDITGVGMESPGIGYPYLKKGAMTGRPTRTIIQFIYQMVCPHEKGDEC